MANIAVLIKTGHVGASPVAVQGLSGNLTTNRCSSGVSTAAVSVKEYEYESKSCSGSSDKTKITLPLLMQTAKCPAVVRKTEVLDNLTLTSMPSLCTTKGDSLVAHCDETLKIDKKVNDGREFGKHPQEGSVLTNVIQSTEIDEETDVEILEPSFLDDVPEIVTGQSGYKIHLKKNKKKKKKGKHKNRPKTSSSMLNVSTPQQRKNGGCNLSAFTKPLTLSAKATPTNLTKQMEYSSKLKYSNLSEGRLKSSVRSKAPLATAISLDESLLNNSKRQYSVPYSDQPDKMVKSKGLFRLKVYMSEKQSGTLRELGLEFPCAPPVTPRSDSSHQCEYVPSLSDIRSQRTLKARLENIQKRERHKREKEKEEKLKLSKIQNKEKEKELKKRQRQEIYALNKIMTQLEHQNFELFCKEHGLNCEK